MDSKNIEWVKEQLTAAKVSQVVGTSVLRLLEVWETMNHKEETAYKTIEVFSKLAMGHMLVETSNEDYSGTWVQAQPGQIKVSDIVRVQTDVFTGDLGRSHNGRIGRVVGVRYGDIIVKTVDNKSPQLDGAHYSPHMLDKLIK